MWKEFDFKQAFGLHKEAAEIDHVKSMCLLGDCYQYGHGCILDLHQAFHWYKKAAHKDHCDSMFKLSVCYENGWGCERDPDQAFYWKARIGADEGNPHSMYELGTCYKHGHGCKQDWDLALEWWEKAAQQEDGPDELYQYGRHRTGTDYAVAYNCFSIASKHGHKQAIIELGACYKFGRGCTKDSDLALQWWEKVAQREGGAEVLYKYGSRRIEDDYSVGYGCLSIAIKFGHKQALAFLMYYHQKSERVRFLDKKIQELRKIHDDDPSDFIAVFLLAECLSNSFKLKDLDEATSLLATIPQDVTIYARSQWLVPFLREKKNIILLSAQSGQSFPTESDYFDPNDLAIVALIGEGQFGKVYLAEYMTLSNRGADPRFPEIRDSPPAVFDCRWVAVKYLNDNELKEHQDAVIKLMRERLANQILKGSRSRNTAKYMGIVTDFKNKKSGLVFEICADLSLVLEDAEDRMRKRDYVGEKSNFESLPDWRSRVPSSLRSTVVFARATSFSMAQLMDIFRNVAIALQCLHILGILHRDIADRNVLFDGEGNVQLADFGMSCFVGVGTDFDDQTMLEYSHKPTEGNQYAVAWWAPECLGDKPIFSFASDVYSFFVMVWQCLSREDPFSHLLEGEGDPFVLVSNAIISGERPDLNKLREDTPELLGHLMEDCWAADPSKRPTLSEVIEELQGILEDLEVETPNRPIKRRRMGNEVEHNWFAVEKMYLEKPRAKLVEDARDAGNGSFQYALLQRQIAEKQKSAPSITVLSESTLALLGGRRPCDVFMLHGEQKWIEVSGAKRTLEHAAGYVCFLDCDMQDNQGRPVDQMGFHLESSRYTFVLISNAFLTKKHPCKELLYAFDRAQWLEGFTSSRSPSQAWRSLRVVLLDLSVEDYTNARQDPNREANGLPPLPPLQKTNILREFKSGHGKIKDWPTLSEQLAEELMRHDKEDGAVDCWNDFLQSWESLPEQDFPRANNVYYAS